MSRQRDSQNKKSKTNPAREMPRESLAGTDAILESISDGVFTVDHDWNIASFNRAAETTTGIPRDEAIGRPCNEVFRSSMCETGCALRETLESGIPVIGRTGYIIKPDGNRIPVSVSTAVLRDNDGNILGGAETFRDLSEIEVLREAAGQHVTLGEMTSSNPAMQRVFELIHALAPMETTVLVTGETGSGKELVARAIHSEGQRVKQPFVAINCAALPDTLLESELFGHIKGAFTGADRDHPGVFARAGKGTLFLDEIGEISQAMQVRLLRVLQERQYTPLGGTTIKHVYARIITATNLNLAQRVADGQFREDLYYRINVVKIKIPPLRERKEDIPLLAERFLTRASALTGRPLHSISPDAMALLLAHDWPGNVRELQNAIERGAVLCRDGVIHADDISLLSVPTSTAQTNIKAVPPVQTTPKIQRLNESQDESMRASILLALEKSQGHRKQAAEILGVHPATLFRRMKALGIRGTKQDGRSTR